MRARRPTITKADQKIVYGWVVDAYTVRERPRKISLNISVHAVVEVAYWIARLRGVHQRYVEPMATSNADQTKLREGVRKVMEALPTIRARYEDHDFAPLLTRVQETIDTLNAAGVTKSPSGRPLEPWVMYAISLHDPICALLQEATGDAERPGVYSSSPLVNVMASALTAIDGRTDRTENAIALQLAQWRRSVRENNADTYVRNWQKIVEGRSRVSRGRVKKAHK